MSDAKSESLTRKRRPTMEEMKANDQLLSLLKRKNVNPQIIQFYEVWKHSLLFLDGFVSYLHITIVVFQEEFDDSSEIISDVLSDSPENPSIILEELRNLETVENNEIHVFIAALKEYQYSSTTIETTAKHLEKKPSIFPVIENASLSQPEYKDSGEQFERRLNREGFFSLGFQSDNKERSFFLSLEFTFATWVSPKVSHQMTTGLTSTTII